MTYDELRGRLLAYETTQNSLDTKERGVTLKSKISKFDDESSDDFSDEELMILAKRFRRLMSTKGKGIGSSSGYKKEAEHEENMCFIANHDQLDEVAFHELSNDDLLIIVNDLNILARKLLDKYNICKSEKKF
ncbi:hypothetical protein PIB30_044472 [Stylosanthes scabra]|uniref:Uncharacterized protein n=1 Tax=Stylosanthes scabra TaxID=79078 RepID=A0ABU6VEW0_9FABA|nr:hypothetical protein [Stylosanthes scabra]